MQAHIRYKGEISKTRHKPAEMRKKHRKIQRDSFASASWVGDWMNHLFYLPNVSSFCLSNVNVESDEPADLTDWIFTVSCFFSQINLVSVYSIKDFVHSVQLFFPSGRKSGCQMIFVAASKMLN